MKNFSLREIYNDNKTKVKVLSKVILRMRYIASINLLACVPACACAIARVSWNSMHVNKEGQTSAFLFGIYWLPWKTNFIKKAVEVGQKNVRTLMFTMLFFFFKKRKTPRDIITLHLCTKHLEDMIHSSWDIECDRLKLVFMGHFLPF